MKLQYIPGHLRLLRTDLIIKVSNVMKHHGAPLEFRRAKLRELCNGLELDIHNILMEKIL